MYSRNLCIYHKLAAFRRTECKRKSVGVLIRQRQHPPRRTYLRLESATVFARLCNPPSLRRLFFSLHCYWSFKWLTRIALGYRNDRIFIAMSTVAGSSGKHGRPKDQFRSFRAPKVDRRRTILARLSNNLERPRYPLHPLTSLGTIRMIALSMQELKLFENEANACIWSRADPPDPSCLSLLLIPHGSGKTGSIYRPRECSLTRDQKANMQAQSRMLAKHHAITMSCLLPIYHL